MKIDNFFAELKRRNVYKVAVAYAVVAWLVIQAASILLRRSTRRLGDAKVIVLTRAGFPASAGFFLGIRDHLRRNRSRIRSESRACSTGRRTARQVSAP